ncbi:MAG: dockerin type I domain-containing protein [Saprospiraceae bacterium]
MQKCIFILTLLCAFGFVNLTAQNQSIQNFTFTDIDGNVHNLYQDHLDQGKTVVLKFFFTSCPPCRANAPHYQQKNMDWGNNQHDTRFMELSILTNDDNTKVRNYKNTFGMTVISAGSDGDADAVTDIFKSGIYGPWYGTPSFAVIAPNRTLYYPIFFDELEGAIEATGAIKPGNNIPDPTVVQLNLTANIPNLTEGSIRFYMKSSSVSTPKYEITKNSQGVYTFDYPSDNFPRVDNPEVYMETNASAYHSTINSIDLIAIQRHILGSKPFTLPEQTLAADVNGDTKINSIDLINIQKVIIGSLVQFPNQVKSYKSIPEKLTVNENSGQTIILPFKVVKMGNIQ